MLKLILVWPVVCPRCDQRHWMPTASLYGAVPQQSTSEPVPEHEERGTDRRNSSEHFRKWPRMLRASIHWLRHGHVEATLDGWLPVIAGNLVEDQTASRWRATGGCLGDRYVQVPC